MEKKKAVEDVEGAFKEASPSEAIAVKVSYSIALWSGVAAFTFWDRAWHLHFFLFYLIMINNYVAVMSNLR